MEFYTGQKLSDLEPRRLFPVSGLNDYITFLDSEGEEQFILRRLDNMEPHQRELLQGCLEEYYRIPKIKRLLTSARSIAYGSGLWRPTEANSPSR